MGRDATLMAAVGVFSFAVLSGRGSAAAEPIGPPTGPRVLLAAPLEAVPAEPSSGSLVRLSGAATSGDLGDPRSEKAGHGIVLASAAPSGGATWKVTGIDSGRLGRWYVFRIRALVQEQFNVRKDDLFLRVDFASAGGTRPLDLVTKSIFEQVERERADLRDEGTNRNLGGATWRSYAMPFHLPFPEIDTVELTVGFANGAGGPERSELWVDEVELRAIPAPEDSVAPRGQAGRGEGPTAAVASLVPIGGRWYFDPRGGPRAVPTRFDHTNADRLLYLDERLEAPFVGNTTAWLRAGHLDVDGRKVEQDRFVPDNVVISFTPTHMVVKSRNLPNHPTAVFPDRWRLLDGNPNFIQEQDFTWHIPLEPRENPNRVAMDETNSNRGLPGGPIGVAVNGVVFFNPFDEHGRVDAVWRTDRCCGHPSPSQSYHYHKYPVCLNTPWSDDGTAHSPLIGFLFDGFPVYGPYEMAGEMAQHSKTRPLNAFNAHFDESRGWHYHVTPGRYPHIAGGFWGELETRNRPRRGPPGGPNGSRNR